MTDDDDAGRRRNRNVGRVHRHGHDRARACLHVPATRDHVVVVMAVAAGDDHESHTGSSAALAEVGARSSRRAESELALRGLLIPWQRQDVPEP